MKEEKTSLNKNCPIDDDRNDEMKAEMELLAQERKDALLKAKESQEETQALLQALDLLSKLASLDHAIYSSTLSGSGESVGSNNFPPIDPDTDVSSLQSRLDSLQCKWKLEETPIPKLSQNIHRLQSNTSQLVREADQQTLHLHSMEAYCAKREKREEKLEKAIHKLHEQNRKLRHKLLSKKRERKSIVKNVKEYVNHVNLVKKKKEDLTIEEQRVANQLKAHERLLRLERFERAALDDGGVNGGGSRSRISTYDSLHDMGENRSRLSTFDSIGSFSDPDLDEVSSVVSSVSSVSTASSFVTDEGVATVRYTPSRSTIRNDVVAPVEPATPEEDAWLSMRAAFGCAKPPEKPVEQKLTFPTGTKIGLQFHKVPMEKEEEKAPRKGLLNEALLLLDDTPDESNKKSVTERTPDPQPSNTKPKDSSAPPPRALSIKFNFDSMLRRSSKNEDGVQKMFGKSTNEEGSRHKVVWLNSRDDDSKDESVASKPGDNCNCAFLVCGFNGFDRQLNDRPKLGARLVAVDQLSLEDGKWTLAQIREAMQARASEAQSGDSQSTFTMTFRNEPLNKKQKEILNRAVKATEVKQQQHNAEPKNEVGRPAPASADDDSNAADVDRIADQQIAASQQADEDDRIEENAPRTDSAAAGSMDGKSNDVDDKAGAEKPSEKFKKSMKEMGNKFKLKTFF